MTLLLTGERTFDPAPFDAISFDLCTRRDDVVILSADLSKYCQVVRVKSELPRQHLDVGMAEQNLLSVAAGVAKGGLIPVATCFACYITRRAYDQMMICMGTGPRTSIAVGFTPGIANPARIHHQAAEDLGMVRAIPNAHVFDPADPTDFRGAVEAAVNLPGLTYIRGHRGDTPRILDPDAFSFEVGRTYVLKQGRGIGIIASGHGTQWALEASEILEEQRRGSLAFACPHDQAGQRSGDRRVCLRAQSYRDCREPPDCDRPRLAGDRGRL